MTRRREFSPKTQAIMFQRAEGRCEGMVDADGLYVGARGDTGEGWRRCGVRIGHGAPWVADHIVPDALDGLNDAENGQCLCALCDAEKTGKRDIPAIAKAKRNAQRSMGIKRQPKRKMPYRKFDGTPVWRN